MLAEYQEDDINGYGCVFKRGGEEGVAEGRAGQQAGGYAVDMHAVLGVEYQGDGRGGIQQADVQTEGYEMRIMMPGECMYILYLVCIRLSLDA